MHRRPQDYARHFLSSCARTLQGVEASPSSITFRGRTTTCGVWPIGIEPDNFITMVKSEPAQMKLNELCVRFAGMRVMVAVDRLDPIKGVPHRLLGLDALFRRHPEWIGKVVMIQVAVPSRTDVDAYQALTQTVNTLIGRINAEFGTLSYTPGECTQRGGWLPVRQLGLLVVDALIINVAVWTVRVSSHDFSPPTPPSPIAVHYLYRSVDPSELAALYTVADAALVTSLRDGMNLVSFEYVACQSQPCANRTSPGVLVLSEFAGAAQSLAGALRCNPWNPNEVAETLHAALTLSAADRQLRHDKLYSYVSVHTAPAWALAYVSAMEVAGKRAAQARKDRAHSISRLPAPAVADRYADAGSRLIVIGYEDVVQGKGLRLGAGEVAAIQPTMKSSTTTAATAQAGVAGRALDPSSTAAATMHSPRRSAHLPAPSTTTIRVLQLLCADPRNVVVLVSSADRDFLEAAFAPVPALRIIAESGAMVRIPTMTVADETATLRIRAELEAPLTVSLDRAGGQELLRKVQHTAETTLQLEKEHPLQPPSMDTSYTQDAAASSMLIPHAGAVGAASAGRGGGDGIGGVDIRPTVIGLFDQQQQHLPHKATPVSSIVTSSSRGPVPSLPHASMKQHDRLPTTPVHSIRLRSSSMLSGSPGFAATEKAKAGRAARASSATAIDDNAKQEYRASVQQPTAQPAQPSSAPNMLTAVSTRWYATVPEAVGAQPRACRLMIKKPATRPTTTATAAAAAAGEAKAPLRAPSSGVLLERVPSSLIEEEQAAAAADAGQQHHHQVEAVWKATLRPILRYYALSTPGSVVEETANSLVWRYEGADPELAMWQAKDLQAHLESTTLAPAPLDIVVPPGAKALEVRVRGATVLNGLLHVIDDHMATARSSSGGGCITGTSAPARLPFDFLVCMTDGRDTESIAAAAAALSTLDIVDGIGGGGVEVTTAKTAIYLTRVAPPEGAHRKGGLGTAAPSSHARISSVSSIPGGDGSAAATGGSVAGTYGWYPGTVSESLRRVDFEVQGTPEARAVLGQLANITKAALMPPALVTPAPASVQPRQQQPTQHRYQSQEKQPVVDGSKSPNVVQKAMVSSSASTAASPASQPSAGQR